MGIKCKIFKNMKTEITIKKKTILINGHSQNEDNTRRTLHPSFHHEIMTHKSQRYKSLCPVKLCSMIPSGCL